jgi:hypothetical protein
MVARLLLFRSNINDIYNGDVWGWVKPPNEVYIVYSFPMVARFL